MSSFGDLSVTLAIIFTFLSTIGCIIYGILKWNEGDISTDEAEKERRWDIEQEHINRELDSKGGNL